jgi:hypothetical protein
LIVYFVVIRVWKIISWMRRGGRWRHVRLRVEPVRGGRIV